MLENPNYYAIIPANVRYSKITSNAKLLYGEITALASKNGICHATNKYFAELYGVSKISISNWIKELTDEGFITNEIVYKEGTKEIINRFLRIATPIKENFNTPIKENFNTPIKENFKENNTSNNNTSINNITPYIPLKSKNENLEEIIPEDDKAYLPAMNTWLEYKKEIKKTYKSQSSVLMCLKRLKQLSKDNPDTAMKIVEQSIANNWVGLFGLKDGKVYNSEEEKEPYVDHYVNFLIEKNKKAEEEKKRLEMEKQKEEERRAKVTEVNIDDIKVEDLPVF